MRSKLLLVVPIAFGLFLACSSGRSQPKTPPPKKQTDYTIREVLMTLAKKKVEVRTNAADTGFVFDFHKSARFRLAEIELIGDDYVRVLNGTVRMNIPYHAIMLVATN